MPGVDHRHTSRVFEVGVAPVGHLRDAPDVDRILAAAGGDDRLHGGVPEVHGVASAEREDAQPLHPLEHDPFAGRIVAADQALELGGDRGVGVPLDARVAGTDAVEEDGPCLPGRDGAIGRVIGHNLERGGVAQKLDRDWIPVLDDRHLPRKRRRAGDRDGGEDVSGIGGPIRKDVRRRQAHRIRECRVVHRAGRNVADAVPAIDAERVGLRRTEHVDLVVAARATAVGDPVAGAAPPGGGALERDQVILVGAPRGAEIVERDQTRPIRDDQGLRSDEDLALLVVDDQRVVAVATEQRGGLEDLSIGSRIEDALDLRPRGIQPAPVGQLIEDRFGAAVLGGEDDRGVGVDGIGEPLRNGGHRQRIGGIGAGSAGREAKTPPVDRHRPGLPGDDLADQVDVGLLVDVRG